MKGGGAGQGSCACTPSMVGSSSGDPPYGGSQGRRLGHRGLRLLLRRRSIFRGRGDPLSRPRTRACCLTRTTCSTSSGSAARTSASTGSVPPKIRVAEGHSPGARCIARTRIDRAGSTRPTTPTPPRRRRVAPHAPGPLRAIASYAGIQTTPTARSERLRVLQPATASPITHGTSPDSRSRRGASGTPGGGSTAREAAPALLAGVVETGNRHVGHHRR